MYFQLTHPPICFHHAPSYLLKHSSWERVSRSYRTGWLTKWPNRHKPRRTLLLAHDRSTHVELASCEVEYVLNGLYIYCTCTACGYGTAISALWWGAHGAHAQYMPAVRSTHFQTELKLAVS